MNFHGINIDKYNAWDEGHCVKGTNRGFLAYDKDACCGNYPNRRAYTSVLNMCCPGGKVKPKKGYKSVEYICGGKV